MSKRYFKINTGSRGGELAIGSVSKEFVDYWKSKVAEDGDSDLIEHLQGIEWEDEDMMDSESPKPSEEYYCWNETDDLEHANGPFADSDFLVNEITLHEDAIYEDGLIQWKEDVDHDYSTMMFDELDEGSYFPYEACIYSRECYSGDVDSEKEADYQPTLFFFSSEKGTFGEVYVETDGEDFDSELFQTGQLECDMGEIIESYWYDRKPLQVDFDYSDSLGKGYYASVGYVNTKWHDVAEKYQTYDMEETENVKESFDCFYEDRE